MPTPDEIDTLARRYAAAWSAHDREAVRDFFAPDGRTRVNGGAPATGRAGIGARVSLRGWEEWTLTEDRNFAEVSGWFDEADYQRQLAAVAG